MWITPVPALSMVTVARARCLRDSPPRVFGATSPRGSGSEAIKLWWEGREGFARVSIFHYDHMKLALVPGGPGQPLLAAGHRRSYGAVIKNTPRQHLAASIFYLMDWPRGCLMCHMSYRSRSQSRGTVMLIMAREREGYSGRPGRGDHMSSMGSHWLCVYDISVNGHNHCKQSCPRWHWDLMRVPTQTCRSCTFRQRQSVKRYFSKNIKFRLKVCHFRSAHSQGPVSAGGSHTHSARCLSWPERSGRPWRTTGWWRTPATSRPPGARRWGSWPARVTTHNVITDRSRPGTRGPTVPSWTWCRASCRTCQGWRKTRSMSYQVRAQSRPPIGDECSTLYRGWFLDISRHFQ